MWQISTSKIDKKYTWRGQFHQFKNSRWLYCKIKTPWGLFTTDPNLRGWLCNLAFFNWIIYAIESIKPSPTWQILCNPCNPNELFPPVRFCNSKQNYVYRSITIPFFPSLLFKMRQLGNFLCDKNLKWVKKWIFYVVNFFFYY